MKKIRFLLPLLVFAACGTARDNVAGQTEVMMINSEQVDCYGVAPMKCFQVKLVHDGKPEGEWTNMYTSIAGFDYEPGYVYTLEVKKETLDARNVPQDASSVRYTLIKVLSKTIADK